MPIFGKYIMYGHTLHTAVKYHKCVVNLQRTHNHLQPIPSKRLLLLKTVMNSGLHTLFVANLGNIVSIEVYIRITYTGLKQCFQFYKS